MCSQAWFLGELLHGEGRKGAEKENAQHRQQRDAEKQWDKRWHIQSVPFPIKLVSGTHGNLEQREMTWGNAACDTGRLAVPELEAWRWRLSNHTKESLLRTEWPLNSVHPRLRQLKNWQLRNIQCLQNINPDERLWIFQPLSTLQNQECSPSSGCKWHVNLIVIHYCQTKPLTYIYLFCKQTHLLTFKICF